MSKIIINFNENMQDDFVVLKKLIEISYYDGLLSPELEIVIKRELGTQLYNMAIECEFEDSEEDNGVADEIKNPYEKMQMHEL